MDLYVRTRLEMYVKTSLRICDSMSPGWSPTGTCMFVCVLCVCVCVHILVAHWHLHVCVCAHVFIHMLTTYLGDPWGVDEGEVEHFRREDLECDRVGRDALQGA